MILQLASLQGNFKNQGNDEDSQDTEDTQGTDNAGRNMRISNEEAAKQAAACDGMFLNVKFPFLRILRFLLTMMPN